MKPSQKMFVLLCCMSLFVACAQDPLTQSSGTHPTTGANGTTLTADITATAKYIKRYSWKIEKTADPTSIDMFIGDSKDVTYTVKLTRDDGTTEAYLEGKVCVTNGGAEATENLKIKVDLFKLGGSNPPVLNTITLDLSGNPVLDPGEVGCYDYSINIPSPIPGATYKVTADISITNHSGHLGTEFGPNPSATAVLPDTPTEIDASVSVADTNGMNWNFDKSDSVTYTKTFTCDKDAGEYKNTATFTTSDTKTTGSSSATVTVKCYKLEVSKTANTSLTRTHKWKINKSADQTSLTLSAGQEFLVNYTVSVYREGSTDSDWAVSGNITVNNPAPISATINAVSDVISGGISPSVNCGVSFPYSLMAGSSLTCSYSSSLPDGQGRTNTATATLQNTPGGTTDFSGSAAVEFGRRATITEKDTSVSVTDSLEGNLGTVTGNYQTFNYTRKVSYATCGQYLYNNIATFTTNDTKTAGSSSWTVNVNVPCAGGCSLTIGYWKTHSKYGPAKYDDTWASIGEDTQFFGNSSPKYTWYSILWAQPQGNAYIILGRQYVAAVLNQINGANTSAITSTLASAQTLLNTYKVTSSLSGSLRNQFLSLATTLDNYNNGLIGPGHCSE